MYKGFSIEHMRMIHRHPGKALTVTDIPRGSSLAIKLKGAAMRLGMAPGAKEEFLRLQREREEYMVQSLSPKLGELIKMNPTLGTKERLKVLMYLGSDHGGVYELLTARGERVERQRTD